MVDHPLALPLAPIPPDLVKEMAMDIGKEVAAYIDRMYPKAAVLWRKRKKCGLEMETRPCHLLIGGGP